MKRFVRGQSMVELALVLPFLLLITVGTMELGYYIYTYSELENAARRGSEWASLSPPWTIQDCDDVLTAAQRSASCPVDPAVAGQNGTHDACAGLIKQSVMDGIVLSRLRLDNIKITYPGVKERKVGELIQVEVRYQGEWLSPIGRRFFGSKLNFSFTSRRTIQSDMLPDGMQPGCK